MLTTYDPNKKIIQDSKGNVEPLDCGRDLHPVAAFLFRIKNSEMTLQQSFDRYLLLEEAGEFDCKS